jgi:hypothetical protein
MAQKKARREGWRAGRSRVFVSIPQLQPVRDRRRCRTDNAAAGAKIFRKPRPLIVIILVRDCGTRERELTSQGEPVSLDV